MCGGSMRLVVVQSASHIPGYEDTSPKQTREWVCPDCDYFEEVDDVGV
jgi:acetone carboxylase gamma subunit